MHEIEVGKTAIKVNESINSREGLVGLLGDESLETVVLAQIENGVCCAKVCLNNRPQTRSCYPSGSLSLNSYAKHSGALFAIEREFNRLKGLIYQQLHERLKERGISSRFDASVLHLANGASLFGTGTLNYYVCNEYSWPSEGEVEDYCDLMLHEVALCSVATGLFYDMANRVVMDNKTIVGDVMYDKFANYLSQDVDVARQRFRNEALSEDFRRSMEEAVRLTQEADATLMGKG